MFGLSSILFLLLQADKKILKIKREIADKFLNFILLIIVKVKTELQSEYCISEDMPGAVLLI